MILMEEHKTKTSPDFHGKMILMEKWSSGNLLRNLWLFIYSKFSNEDTLVPASWGPWALVMSEVKMAMPVLRCEPNDQMALKYVETSVLVARKAFLAGFSVWNARPQNMNVLFLFGSIRKLIAFSKSTWLIFHYPKMETYLQISCLGSTFAFQWCKSSWQLCAWQYESFPATGACDAHSYWDHHPCHQDQNYLGHSSMSVL